MRHSGGHGGDHRGGRRQRRSSPRPSRARHARGAGLGSVPCSSGGRARASGSRRCGSGGGSAAARRCPARPCRRSLRSPLTDVLSGVYCGGTNVACVPVVRAVPRPAGRHRRVVPARRRRGPTSRSRTGGRPSGRARRTRTASARHGADAPDLSWTNLQDGAKGAYDLPISRSTAQPPGRGRSRQLLDPGRSRAQRHAGTAGRRRRTPRPMRSTTGTSSRRCAPYLVRPSSSTGTSPSAVTSTWMPRRPIPVTSTSTRSARTSMTRSGTHPTQARMIAGGPS